MPIIQILKEFEEVMAMVNGAIMAHEDVSVKFQDDGDHYHISVSGRFKKRWTISKRGHSGWKRKGEKK